MFASPYFDPARDWREISARAHELLSQSTPEELLDELVDTSPAQEELRRVA